MDKKSTSYFMTQMTQKEYEKILKDRKNIPYEFNTIKLKKK